ncbi:uncharacterized protein LOC143189495 [Rhynchophorus ferrugineus]|uniref:uncharacterized protein LOC143189495 n=1 Tax=Rhynchophorus ferrugineus TaxID=354439 RepID=UPI003FCCD03A
MKNFQRCGIVIKKRARTVSRFLRNKKAEKYKKLVENMLKIFKAMDCKISLKVHVLRAHLDKFKNNMGAYSEEQGERFHQDIMSSEQRITFKFIFYCSLLGLIWAGSTI